MASDARAMSLEFNDYQCDISFQEHQALSEVLSVWFICASLSEPHSDLSQAPRGAWVCSELAELNW